MDQEQFIELSKPKKPTSIKQEEEELTQPDWAKLNIDDAKRLQKVIEEKYLIPFNELMEQFHSDSDKAKAAIYKRLRIDESKETIICGYYSRISKMDTQHPWESLHKHDQEFIRRNYEKVENWLS